MTWLAIVFAVASALTTAFSTSVQHLAAGQAPESASGLVGLLRHLVSRPWWVVGQVLGILAFVFHGAAMHNGPIALVQPIVICGIVFAVPLRAAISRAWPARRELGAVVLTAVALAAFLVASRPHAGSRTSFGWLFGLLVTLCAALAYAAIWVARFISDGTRRGFLLGVVSGVMFGLVAVLLKATQVVLADRGVGAMLLSWPLYALVVTGISGVAVNQLAYRNARLSASMPVLNVVDGAVALAFGYLAFHEVPRHDPVALVVEVATLPALFAGLWILARHEAVEQEQDEDAQAPSGYGSRV